MAPNTQLSAKRPTYGQQWRPYNAAQVVEKEVFQALLADLCAGLPRVLPKTGRPPLLLSDAIFAFSGQHSSSISKALLLHVKPNR